MTTARVHQMSVTCQSSPKHNMQFSLNSPQRNGIPFFLIIKLQPTPKKGSEVEMDNT